MAITIPWLNKKRSSDGRIGLEVGPDGLAVVYINGDQQLSFCSFYENLGDSKQLLANLVSEHGWKDIPCTVVLHPVYYQLVLSEVPKVESQELASAVRWKAKESLDFSIEEAAIEYFLLPDDAYRGRQKMLYAAALRKDTLQSLVNPIEEAGLSVDVVEIAELALHNIISRLPNDRGGSAIVQLYDAEGFINLVEDGAVYLCRRLDQGFEKFDANADNTAFFESLLLEIQRSMDFYESQLGKGIVSNLYLSPDIAGTSQLGAYLSSQLGLNIAPIDPAELGYDLDDNSARCITALGAALQPPSTNTHSTNVHAKAAGEN